MLSYIEWFSIDRRLTPTLREIADHFGWCSAKSADTHIQALIRKGWLTQRVGAWHVAPSLAIVAQPKPKVLCIYVAGPMTGLPSLNFPAFYAEATRLRADGYEVVNPAELNPDPAMPWHECMRRDIAALVTCDVIQLLPGWANSKGATLEEHIAQRLGMKVWLPPTSTAAVTP